MATAVRGAVRVALGATWLLTGATWLPATVHAQDTPLERWTVGYVADGWSPRWRAAGFDGTNGGPERLSIRFGAELLSLGGALRQTSSLAEVALRQPLGPSLAVAAAAASGSRRTETGGRVLADTPRAEAGALGVEMGDEIGGLGRLQLGLTAGWDGGLGGAGQLTVGGERYRLRVGGWRTTSRDARVFFPADSLRDVGVGHLAMGVSAVASSTLEAGPVSFSPSLRFEIESIQQSVEAAPDAFLRSSPSGDTRLYDLGLDVAVMRWLVGGRFRRRSVDVEGLLQRGGQSAGRLFFTDLAYRRWSAHVGLLRPGTRWSVELEGERSQGRLSTRVETWPFADLWTQLVTQAYRLRGNLEARVLSFSLRRRSLDETGWSGALSVARHRVRSLRDSWFVTAFGFGRTDRVTTVSGVDPAIVVGAALERPVSLAGGVAELRVEGGLPVHADELVREGGDPRPSAKEGLHGYVAVSVGWRR